MQNNESMKNFILLDDFGFCKSWYNNLAEALVNFDFTDITAEQIERNILRGSIYNNSLR